jgi:hypothetical protein
LCSSVDTSEVVDEAEEVEEDARIEEVVGEGVGDAVACIVTLCVIVKVGGAAVTPLPARNVETADELRWEAIDCCKAASDVF